MPRGTWSIDKWNGSSWVSDGTIYRPNQNLDIPVLSTQRKYQLADGTNTFVLPENVYTKEPLTFFWLEIAYTDSFKSKIDNYIVNGDYLRITNHLSETYTGRFIYIKPVWLIGTTDTYDYEASFERMV